MPLALLVEIFLPNKFSVIEGYPPPSLPPYRKSSHLTPKKFHSKTQKMVYLNYISGFSGLYGAQQVGPLLDEQEQIVLERSARLKLDPGRGD